MRTAFALIALVLCGVLQVTVGASLGAYWPNLMIVMIVVLATLLPLDSLLLPTILAGLLSDYYSGADFGLHIAYYLICLLVAKLVFKLGEKEPSKILTVALAISFNFLYSFIRIVGGRQFLQIDQWSQIGWIFIWRGVITAVLTILLLAGVKKLYQLSGRWSRFYSRSV